MMKKALQISIAQTLFTIEDDAYATLEAYLVSVKEHFKNTEGHEEILKDIESRIAEQLLESKETVITQKTLEKVLTRMGKVEDFDDAENTREGGTAAEEKGPLIGDKRLYRNPDDKFIAGVCSGLAAYFGIEAVWVRLAFIVATLVNGLGILVYIVLWIIIPEAKTGGQKLEMTGSPVNLETISETVRERVSEIKENRGALREIIAFPFRVIGTVLTFILNILNPLLRISVGTILVLAATAALVGVMIALGFLLSDNAWLFGDIPLQTLAPGMLRWLFLGGATFALLIPLLFLLLGGLSLLQKKALLTGAGVLGLLGMWFLALVICSFGVASTVGHYRQFVDSSPSYQEVRQTIPLEGDFGSIKMSRGIDVELIQGTSTSLTATGREKDMGRVSARIENGSLVIERVRIPENNFCLFCFSEAPHLTLNVQDIENIALASGSSISSSALSIDSLTLTLEDGSSAELTLEVGSLTAEVSSGSLLRLKGDAATALISLDHGSSMQAEDLKIEDAAVTAANGSFAEVQVRKTLNADASRGSFIRYTGNPQVTESTKSGGEVKSAQ